MNMDFLSICRVNAGVLEECSIVFLHKFEEVYKFLMLVAICVAS